MKAKCKLILVPFLSLVLPAGLQAAHPGTVFSITPAIKNHRPVAVVLLANKGKVMTVNQPL